MFVQQRKRHRLSDTQSVVSVDSAAVTEQLPQSSRAQDLALKLPFAAGAAAAAPMSPAAVETTQPQSSSQLDSAAATPDLNNSCNPKRTFACRICGFPLSSASNRIRHERAKHKSTTGGLGLGAKRSLQEAFGTGDRHEEAAAAAASDEVQPMELDDVESAAVNDRESDRESGSESEEPPPTLDFSSVEGLRPLLKEEDLQACCYPFLVWLSQPPVTQCEALVKARRVKSLTQLQPVKSNLRYIFALLYEREAIGSVDMHQLTRLAICQSLFDAMTNRQVGSGRVHAVFLLVKKVLVYLSSQESTTRHQFVQPTAYESFLFVDNICSDSSHRRKQESRNRALLGAKTSELLHKSQPMPSHQAFVVPTKWSPTVLKAPITLAPASGASATNTKAVTLNSSQAPSNELSKEELQQVAKGCLAFLDAYMQRSTVSQNASVPAIAAAAAAAATSSISASHPSDLQTDRLFMAHLVTATLCLGLAPRSQVLKQMRIGSSFVKQADGRYWVKILAEMSKNGKPTMFAISPQLTAAFDWYFEVIRPRLMSQVATTHDFVFVKHNGSAPRADFSACTCLVTQRLIGRPVNAHAFRAAVVTAFYETGASQSEMDVLANIMAHDPTTAKTFYFRPQQAAVAVQANDKMAELLLQH